MKTNNTTNQGSQTATQGSIANHEEINALGFNKDGSMEIRKASDIGATDNCSICGRKYFTDSKDCVPVHSNGRTCCCMDCYDKLRSEKAELKEQCRSQISASAPSDVVEVDVNTANMLINLRNPLGTKGVPADLFFGSKVPTRDLDIVIDDKLRARVVINQAVLDSLSTIIEEEVVTVGAMVINDITIPIAVEHGCDSIVLPDKALRVFGYAYGYDVVETLGIMWCLLEVWYGIQISLLHPELKHVFRNPRTVPYETGKPANRKKRKKTIKYVRRHIITVDNFEEVLSTRTFNRRALAWYVTGHWRRYKANGRTTFINGFWKGALRDTKKASEVRYRQVF